MLDGLQIYSNFAVKFCTCTLIITTFWNLAPPTMLPRSIACFISCCLWFYPSQHSILLIGQRNTHTFSYLKTLNLILGFELLFVQVKFQHTCVILLPSVFWEPLIDTVLIPKNDFLRILNLNPRGKKKIKKK